MDSTLAILFSLLHILNVCSAAPLPGEVVKMKSKVKWMAEQLVVRLNKDFQVPAGLTLRPPADELDGLSSIVTLLEGYNSLTYDTLNLAQAKFDISSLTCYLDQWRQGHCGEQWPKPSVPGPLEELQRRKDFHIHTVSIEAFMRVKEILSRLLSNLDYLQTC